MSGLTQTWFPPTEWTWPDYLSPGQWWHNTKHWAYAYVTWCKTPFDFQIRGKDSRNTYEMRWVTTEGQSVTEYLTWQQKEEVLQFYREQGWSQDTPRMCIYHQCENVAKVYSTDSHEYCERHRRLAKILLDEGLGSEEDLGLDDLEPSPKEISEEDLKSEEEFGPNIRILS